MIGRGKPARRRAKNSPVPCASAENRTRQSQSFRGFDPPRRAERDKARAKSPRGSFTVSPVGLALVDSASVLEAARFIFILHRGEAWEATLLAAAGSLLAIPAARFRVAGLLALPLFLFRLARRIVGEKANFRMAATIFAFNGSAMFLYMASGIRPALPAAIAFLTGFNLTAILLAGGNERSGSHQPAVPPGAWVPGSRLTALCGLAVLLLELPCFFFAAAMGIRLGAEIQGGLTTYLAGLAPRAVAYGRVVLPLLLVSAICETVAIRGVSGRGVS